MTIHKDMNFLVAQEYGDKLSEDRRTRRYSDGRKGLRIHSRQHRGIQARRARQGGVPALLVGVRLFGKINSAESFGGAALTFDLFSY